jgi:3-oxoacyl-(acyl-carrier-protein) synthase
VTAPSPGVAPRRVAVTGMSVASALGLEVETFWRALLDGACGIAPLPVAVSRAELPVRIAGQVSAEALDAGLRRYRIKDHDRSNRLALYVVGRALEDAGLPADGSRDIDADLIMGTGHGNIAFSSEAAVTFFEHGYRKLRPSTVVRLMFNRPASLASIRYRLCGASHTVSAACATASVALGEAFHRIRFGVSDCAVVACCDTGLDLPTFAAWNRLGVLSRIPEPEQASRPFDRRRDGLVIGEGAAAFVLESWDTAEARGAAILAEVAGYGASSDARHIVQPDAAGQAKAVRAALASARIDAAEIDYVNAHGTATELADVVEAESLRLALGVHGEAVPVSNTKAQLGHLMGATAGVELAATILAMRHGLIPPCRNLDDPDPRCPLNFVRKTPLERRVGYALKNSFAFGGTNSVVVLKRAAD